MCQMGYSQVTLESRFMVNLGKMGIFRLQQEPLRLLMLLEDNH